MQRAASLRMDDDVETARSLNADGDEHDVPQVRDMTPRICLCLPRFFLCLPMCLQAVVSFFVLVIFSTIAYPLMGPMIILTSMFLWPATRQLLRDYEEKSDIVEGRVVERNPYTTKFFGSISSGFCITVEYHVGDATFRKKFIRVSKENYDEWTMKSTLDLLVVPGKPKSAMLKTGIEQSIALHSDKSRAPWKHILIGIWCSLFAPVHLASMYMGDSFFSWGAVRHGCVIGVISSLVACILYWWWDPVAKQHRAFLESAERVGGDDDYEQAIMPSDDSLTAPLLSVVTGI